MLTVNITTTSSRIFLCSATVWSLVHQDLLPDEIVIWISAEPYLSDKGINEEPRFVAEVNNICNREIVKVRYVKNTGPYRKIFPALKCADENDVLVYADDDVVYDNQWLSTLFSFFDDNDRKYIVASRIRKVTYNCFGQRKSYETFPLVKSNSILADDFIITGVGGAILMKNHIDSKYIFDESFIEICPKTDDIWISKIIELSKSKVLSCPQALNFVQEILHSNFSLSSTNTIFSSGMGLFRFFTKFKIKLLAYLGCLNTNNDRCIRQVEKYFSDK